MAAFLRTTTAGEKALLGRLRGLPKAFLAEMESSIPQEAQALMDQAQVLAPARTGTLKASAVVTHETKPSRVLAAAAYTDRKAAAVHEGIHWGVKREQDTRWHLEHLKWFERALGPFAQGFVDRMAQALRRVLGGG